MIKMGKKKKEHITFDQMYKIKKSIPFAKINRLTIKKKKKK